MITENTLREKRRHVDDVSMNLSEDSFEELYVSDTVINDQPFLETDHANVNNNSKILEHNQFTTIIPSCRTGISLLMELPLKIMNSVSDLLNFQSQSPDSEIPAKRPYSPKPHHNKQTPTDIARGRGRGRGRSQLRRSGVSQTRHRQERIRHRLSAEIQDDLKDLREIDNHQNDDDIPTSPCVDQNNQRIRYSADGIEAETSSSKFPFTFGYCDMKRRKRKQRNKNNNGNQISISNNCKVRYIPECPTDPTTCLRSEDSKDIESEIRMNRKRLPSDRSVDSEDSYCIVFETGSDSEFETDCDYTTTDDEDEDETDEVGDCRSKLKVRFAPQPIIHSMITWDYAYRAARKGPWEEMARDRERFKYRIKCISRVLDPILVPHHRSEIWQHRFAVDL